MAEASKRAAETSAEGEPAAKKAAVDVLADGKYDADQVKMMSEEVILLDENDNVIGKDSKVNTHLVENINKGLLHRAFSVFWFNSEGKLLLQQRAHSKITFPLYWTNTCCSHPLHFDAELEDKDQLGVKRAAVRKLDQELGIPADKVSVDDFRFLTRLHYKALSDGKWGEHEIDYILFIHKDVEPVGNPNEVEDTRWVSQQELRDLFAEAETKEDLKITPWFKLIVENFIYKWWDTLQAEGLEAVAAFKDDKVHKLGEH